MPARLILNADDFGLTPGINRAIAELHSAGALTSATLMANGPAFDDAIRIARAQPTLGIGCHIVLTDGMPVSPPETIPTLLGPDRKILPPLANGFLRGRPRSAESPQPRSRAKPTPRSPAFSSKASPSPTSTRTSTPTSSPASPGLCSP